MNRFPFVRFRPLYNPLLYGVFAVLMLFFSCETPEKVLKSNNLDYKYAKAIGWYNKKEYVKAIPVLEELIGLYKGTRNTEDLYYYYAMANYRQSDYMIAAYHFKNFTNLYPNSQYAEECLYLHARCNKMLSSKAELDQTYTYKALEAYQLFLNTYPVTNYLDQCNKDIQALRKKLEAKALKNADLYYKTSNFRAAATSFETLLVQFPDIEDAERIQFMVVKANFKFAQNSIFSKKPERFYKVIENHAQFAYKYPSSKYLQETKAYSEQSYMEILRAHIDQAAASRGRERVGSFQNAIREYQRVYPKLEERYREEANQLLENSYFQLIKTHYGMAEEFRGNEKLKILEETIQSYYTFVDSYKNSKYQQEAEKLFKKSRSEIEKIKSNG